MKRSQDLNRIAKAYSQMAIKKSISMPRILFEMAAGRQQSLQFATFSDYIQALVRDDVITGSQAVPPRREDESIPIAPRPSLQARARIVRRSQARKK